MPGWKTFLVEPSEFCRRSLRRFGDSTPVHFHDASVVIDEQFRSPGEYGAGLLKTGYETDPRWPLACACGYVFPESDHWQVNEDRLYRGAPDGKLYALRELPPGAIWRAKWMEDVSPNLYAAPDGKAWALMMPAGVEWLIYGPATGGGKWDVQGTLPDITVSPSILQTGCYHGFVKGGVISPDCEGREFPKHPFTA
jgi:hypothetical protein